MPGHILDRTKRRVCVSFLLLSSAVRCNGPVALQRGRPSDLRDKLQQILDSVTSKHATYAVQLGWKSESDHFTLVSGQYLRPDETTYRTATTEDVFLWGSITKPYTAAAVMSLVQRGVVSLDDPLEKHVDTVLGRFEPGTTLRGLFGEMASNITVGHVLRMQSGVQDFDFPPFDNFLLQANETFRAHSPYEFVKFASQQQPPLLFQPGTHVSYSSNNFVLAGLVLLAHAESSEWWELDLPSFFPPPSRPSLGKGYFFQKEPLNSRLTVPGHTSGGWAHVPNTTIWNQSSSILGWTCGNLVAGAGDVASFMWDLLGPEPRVLPKAAIDEMTQFKALDFGWSAKEKQYGIGLMLESASFRTKRPPTLTQWGTYMGHGGDTFGFLSEVGIVYGLNASIAIVVNQDSNGAFVPFTVMCQTIHTAAKVLLELDLHLMCLPRDGVVWV